MAGAGVAVMSSTRMKAGTPPKVIDPPESALTFTEKVCAPALGLTMTSEWIVFAVLAVSSRSAALVSWRRYGRAERR